MSYPQNGDSFVTIDSVTSLYSKCSTWNPPRKKTEKVSETLYTKSAVFKVGPRRLLPQRRSEGGAVGAGRTGRHLLGVANGRKLFLKIHVKIQIVISYVFACNKNKALQLQRVPILSILGYNIGSLAASASTLLVLRQFCVGAGLCRILVRSFLR